MKIPLDGITLRLELMRGINLRLELIGIWAYLYVMGGRERGRGESGIFGLERLRKE